MVGAASLNGSFEDVETALGGGAVDGEGGHQHEDVLFGGDQQAAFPARSTDFARVVLVFQFDADGEACCRSLKTDQQIEDGDADENLDWLRNDSKALAIFDRAEIAQ